MRTMTIGCKNNIKIIDKSRLDKIYFGVCYILNSIEKNGRIKDYNIIFFHKSVQDLNSLKNIIKKIYYKYKFTLPVPLDYINCKHRTFNKEIASIILDTIYRTAVVYNYENSKEFSDFNLIIMVLANLLKNFI